jgi:DNA-binding NarL/FixJ family response regulator
MKVVIADDHPLFCEGLAALLTREGVEVAGVANDGHQALRLCQELAPAAAVLDIGMPVLNGLAAAREIQRVGTTRVVLLTLHRDEEYLLDALRAGIKGYALKSQSGSQVVAALLAVAGGGTYVSPELSSALVESYLARAGTQPPPLSLRESQVLQLIAEGSTTKEVAQALGLSVKTVDCHRTSLMRKLDIHDIAGLVRYAVRRGVVEA